MCGERSLRRRPEVRGFGAEPGARATNHRFRSAPAFASFSGVAPIDVSSGEVQRHRWTDAGSRFGPRGPVGQSLHDDEDLASGQLPRHMRDTTMQRPQIRTAQGLYAFAARSPKAGVARSIRTGATIHPTPHPPAETTPRNRVHRTS
jgi:hypothetical protein